MSFDVHTIKIPDGFAGSRKDRLLVGIQFQVANAAGSGIGAAVTTHVAGKLPGSYAVMVQPGQDASWYVANMTAAGFDVVLTPRLAASTLAAGNFDVVIVG